MVGLKGLIESVRFAKFLGAHSQSFGHEGPHVWAPEDCVVKILVDASWGLRSVMGGVILYEAFEENPGPKHPSMLWYGLVWLKWNLVDLGLGAELRIDEKRKEKKRQGQIKKSQRLYKRVELYQRLVTCLSSGESELHTAFLTSFDL